MCNCWAVNRENAMGLLEGDAIHRAQAERLHQIKQRRQLVQFSPFGTSRLTLAFQPSQIAAFARQVDPYAIAGP